MDISLVHTGLAAGATLAALPVVLHLFMKQTPKHVIFPALRLIRERQKRSRKKLRVKNWLLLLARMALLALMALALARPTINSETTIGDQEVPTALGLVFDTSLSMSYKQPDKDRLELAKERALELIKKTPSSSQIYVVDSSDPSVPPPLTPPLARKRIESLTIHPVNRPLNVAIGQAYAGVVESDKPRREVYVLTDLARSSWDMERPVEGLEKTRKDRTGIKTYVLRLTPRDVRDVSIVEARPASDVVTEGEPVQIIARLRSLGPTTERVVQLLIDGEVRGKKPIKLDANGETEVRFDPLKLNAKSPIHQGQVVLAGTPDPLLFDDTRYFTFTVAPATNVLIVSDLPAEDGVFIKNAIDPEPGTLPPGSVRPFRAESVSTTKFAAKAVNLGKNYRCVFLNNVRSLDESDWRRLSDFVLDGGGLVVALGSRSSPENYGSTLAAQVLPATPTKAPKRKEPTTFGTITDYSHPLFARYPKELGELLGQIPVARHWDVTPHEGSRVLVSYADKAPALVERVFKRSRTGRVLLWSTPLSRRPDPTSVDAWNEFPSEFVGWSFFYLMRQTVSYLSETNEQPLVFDAGANIVLPIDPTRRHKSYNVQDPVTKAIEPLIPAEGSNSIVIVAPQHLGNWTVKPSGTEAITERSGFSVNPPESETQFVPLEKTDLDTLFGGKDRYALAEDVKGLETAISIGRVGRELFPWLIMLIMIIVTAESVLANRFYRETGTKAAVPNAA